MLEEVMLETFLAILGLWAVSSRRRQFREGMTAMKCPLQQEIRAGSLTTTHFSLPHLLHLFLHLLFTFHWRAATFTPSLRMCPLSFSFILISFGEASGICMPSPFSFALTFPSVFSFVLLTLFPPVCVQREKPCYRLVYV